METPFRWFGKQFLGINYSYEINGYGSGDYTYSYITFFVGIVLALWGFTFWTLLDRKRQSYNKFQYWLFVIIRVFLIFFMLTYGFVKVFQIQFQPLPLVKLLQPIGKLSPMGLAWTYMGYSKGFGMFAGFMEILGGLLLIPKRTVTLGAFVIIGVMTQVAMMNLMFDIPVKLFSMHLVLLALILFLSDSTRFMSVFIQDKQIKFQKSFHPIKDEQYHKTIFWIKTIGLLLILVLAGIFGYNAEQRFKAFTDEPPKLYGIWEVSTFIKNSDTIPPLLTEDSRWRYLVIERKGIADVKAMNANLERYKFEVDSVENTINMYISTKEKDSLNLQYHHPNAHYLKLFGRLENDSIEVHLFKKDLNDFPLKTRGFRWINERPYNR
ncbi:DoxX family protein [Winogradskyella sp.]|uniref:DoxX family protein n=1 Tax=Winogradskyella sp. TaxID=1883156 RepID=UPI002618DFE5|nr:DoxX family protein [Winogradskyella sp.]